MILQFENQENAEWNVYIATRSTVCTQQFLKHSAGWRVASLAKTGRELFNSGWALGISGKARRRSG